jgi:ABC-type Fe3+-hydroxamate transport system substrate-binding protein
MPLDILRESIPVYAITSFNAVQDLENLEQVIRSFGVMLGREADAETFIATTNDRLDAYDIVSEPTTKLLVIRATPGANEFWFPPSCGPALARLVECVGYTGEWFSATTEGLLSLNPDIIIVEDWSEGLVLESLSEFPLWNEIDAVRDGRVYLIPPSRTLDYSLISVANSLNTIMPLAYPDIFPAPLTDEQVQEILAAQ